MVSLPWFRENLQFLILEVLKQLDGAQAVIEDQNPKAIEKINTRDDHIDNLKGMIENRCYGEIVQADPKNREFISLLRGINTVSSNLEKVADYSVNIVNQTGYLHDKKFFIEHYEYSPFFKEVRTALKRISKAIFNQDISLALKICACEFKLDRLYETKFKKSSNSSTGTIPTARTWLPRCSFSITWNAWAIRSSTSARPSSSPCLARN